MKARLEDSPQKGAIEVFLGTIEFSSLAHFIYHLMLKS